MPFTPAVPTETNNVDNAFGHLFNVPIENGKGFQRIVYNCAFPGFFPDNRQSRQPLQVSQLTGGDTIRVSPLTASQPSDEMHISNEDIELVMSQADVSRSRAFTALKDKRERYCRCHYGIDHVKITK